MEILSRGKLPSERKYTGTCGSCGTRVKFSAGEACSSGPPDPCFYVPCPVCKHTNIVGRPMGNSHEAHEMQDASRGDR